MADPGELITRINASGAIGSTAGRRTPRAVRGSRPPCIHLTGSGGHRGRHWETLSSISRAARRRCLHPDRYRPSAPGWILAVGIAGTS